jgi:hypothetical protein
VEEKPPRYWFPAKRYGWGWGPPSTWQGWVVLIGWIAILIPVSILLAPYSLPLYFVFLALMVAAIIAICYAKGEPPRWRWGKD